MKRKPDIACKNCGKLFHQKRKETMFCCRECSLAYNKSHGMYKKSDEMKRKLSMSKLGKAPWNKGKHTSAEAIAKFKESIKSVWTDKKREEQRKKQKEVWSDKELLDKHRKIMVDSHASEEVRKKISDSLHIYNSSLSEEEKTARYLKMQTSKQKKGIVYESAGEISVREYIESLGYNVEKYVIGKDNTRFEIDCYIPELKIGVEYNGVCWHSTNGLGHKAINYHFNKSTYANNIGIDLIQIWEDQWKNQNALVKDILRTRLGKAERHIYARVCEIRDVSAADYKEFCINYHIQGYRSAFVKLGLYYKDELVQVASFGKARAFGNSTADKYEWEWIRGCTLPNTIVIGGTSKLFKYFIKKYDPTSILCYCDFNLFTGKGYEEAGFEFTSFTGPNLFFVKNSSTLERINRNPYTNSIHKQLVKEGKLFECHGCGSKKYLWYKGKG